MKKYQTNRSIQMAMLVCFFYLLPFVVSSQNLVPNYGFDQVPSTFPCHWTVPFPDSFEKLETAVPGWFSPLCTTPDFFTDLAPNTCFSSTYSTVDNCVGWEAPRSGHCYVGFYNNAAGGGPECECPNPYDYKEYFGAELLEPMKKGHRYYAEMYVSLGEFSFNASNNLGIAFDSIKHSFRTDTCFMTLKAMVNCDSIIWDTSGWTKVSGFFTAEYDYNYLYIGNFFSRFDTYNPNTMFAYAHSGAYYFAEDVYVVEVDSAYIIADTLICKGDSITITGKGALSHHWYYPDTPKDTLSTTSSLKLKLEEHTTVVLKGNSSYDTIHIKVYEPLVNLDTAYYCLDSSLVNVWIRPSNLSEGSFYWYASDTTEDVLDIGLSYLANDLKDDTVFYIRYEDSKGCINQNKYPVYVKAVAMPEVDFISDKQTVVQYEPIQFSAISRVADSWEWYFGEFDYAKAYSTNPVYSYSDTGRYHVQLQIKDQYGCVNSETKYQYIYVDRHSPVFVPDAFTPNADGLNDILYVRGTVESISFQLYNQWGEQIFQTEDLNIGWDGTFKGKPQAQGNYAYVLIAEPFSGDVIHKQGVVALIR